MAGEIVVTGILKCFNSAQGIDQELRRENISLNQTGDSFARYIQTIGTSEEALELGQDIGTLGLCMIRNLDTTNFVSIKPATGAANTIKIRAGGIAIFEWGSGATAPFVQADTAAVRIEVLLLEL